MEYTKKFTPSDYTDLIENSQTSRAPASTSSGTAAASQGLGLVQTFLTLQQPGYRYYILACFLPGSRLARCDMTESSDSQEKNKKDSETQEKKGEKTKKSEKSEKKNTAESDDEEDGKKKKNKEGQT